ncbi:MAG: hypothetical protein MZV63_32420 [Marinilabiliales bacterium]|nr:hypothetical protein [Marinilabiliales bacterium]
MVETETFDGTLMMRKEAESFNVWKPHLRQTGRDCSSMIMSHRGSSIRNGSHTSILLYGDIEIGGWVKMSTSPATPVHASGSCSQECLCGYLAAAAVHSGCEDGCI